MHSDPDRGSGSRGWPSVSIWARRAGVYAFLAVVCYVPQLLTQPGVVSDDTKTYLYLNPRQLLSQASSMWNPNVALGTVVHQNIGYLFPMGPFFYVFSVLHVPIWIAQRMWLGSILFVAAAGIAYLCRLFGIISIGHVWARRAGVYVVLAVVCYVPQLLTQPGVVSDDTKTYLYLDPRQLLSQASSMWNPNVALGTVVHQNIGYLFPMGPFFYVFSVLHIPIWVAQRMWLGSILFAAAAGIAYLCRLFGIVGVGRVVAALAYGLSPYVMQYTGRISVILLPFAGLPWLMAFIVLAVRKRGWCYPALFALVVASVSGINASSIVYVGIAPLLFLPYAVFVTREISGREVLGVAFRTGVLCLTTSLWWISALAVEGAYGVDILKYTESVEATSSASSASEVIRGLGYWYFYGGDRVGLWTRSSIDFTTRTPLLALSYLVPIGAFFSAAFVRWRERAFFIVVAVVGLLLSVGAHPYGSPTPIGALDKAFMTKTTVGLALRSADRATPVVILGLAMLVGAGVAAAQRRLPRLGLLGGLVAVALRAGR